MRPRSGPTPSILVDGGPTNSRGFWSSPGSYGMRDLEAENPASKVRQYRNSILDAFFKYGGTGRVRVEAWKNGSRQKYATFRSPAGSHQTGWMNKANIIESSWSDFTQSATTNFVSIDGDDGNGRHWFFSRNYGGCEVDAGWMIVMDDAEKGGCGWEIASKPHTSILYAPGDSAAAWADAAHADTYVIYVSFRE